MKIIKRDHSQIGQKSSEKIVRVRIFQILIVFSIIVFSFQINEINASQEKNEEPVVKNSEEQFIPLCGDGTKWDGESSCVVDQPFGGLTELSWIVIGVILGIVATVFGIIMTLIQRKSEQKKESLELIKEYGTQLAEISKTEEDLETKLDCALYAERYLDTLEQIATLYYREMLREDVAEYFENHFRYGMNLWNWYKKNVEKIPDDEIEEQRTRGLKIGATEKEQDDRWFYFRWWCNGGNNEV